MKKIAENLIELLILVFPFVFVQLVFQPVWWLNVLVGVVLVFYAATWAAYSVWRTKDAIITALAYQQVMEEMLLGPPEDDDEKVGYA